MEQLKNWADKVIDTITPFAEKLNRDFYPLQSPIKKDVDILFIGLNPGGGYTYSCQKDNPSWEFRNGRMTVERLLKGNPTFSKGLESWPLFRGLKQIPYINDILQKDNYAYTNYYYISTKSFNEALSDPNQTQAIQQCKELTLELIRLVQPKTILVLGTSNGIDKLPFSNKKAVLHGVKKRLLMSAEFEGIQVFAIPHPSTLAISRDEIKALNTNLIELIENRSLTPFAFDRKVAEQFSVAAFLMAASLRNISFEQFITNDRKAECCKTVKINGDNLLIKIVIKPNEKYLGVRDANAGNKGNADRFYKDILSSDHYCSKVAGPKIVKDGAWLIKKYFDAYEAASLADLYNAILVDTQNLTRI
ncbi:uracil-DNA glycosylase family protein [Sphingobacterium paludis]|uniref:Uracil-DNA glycosylase n=1 Tax=Sphingobacterium paludis TaxID=1476465 RepID=A0A4R7CZ72_9SPHI|nr:uracil-DNA glycosylase family protein [Sphingobacterium paludis]TDS13899.1 uracil-DNA glycosylase [Sphingobacterium paludis]